MARVESGGSQLPFQLLFSDHEYCNFGICCTTASLFVSLHSSFIAYKKENRPLCELTPLNFAVKSQLKLCPQLRYEKFDKGSENHVVSQGCFGRLFGSVFSFGVVGEWRASCRADYDKNQAAEASALET